MKRSFTSRCVAICVVVLPLLLAVGSTVFAQGNSGAVSNKEMRELLKRPGRLISEAKSTRPNGELQLIGYRVEEIELPRNMTVEVQGRQSIVNKVKVTIIFPRFSPAMERCGPQRCSHSAAHV